MAENQPGTYSLNFCLPCSDGKSHVFILLNLEHRRPLGLQTAYQHAGQPARTHRLARRFTVC